MKDADAGAAQCKHFWWNATGLKKTDAVKDADADQCKRTFRLFHTPTGSAHRSVHDLFGFTNRRSDWLTCILLWRANPIVMYPDKHGEYRAVANVMSVANVT